MNTETGEGVVRMRGRVRAGRCGFVGFLAFAALLLALPASPVRAAPLLVTNCTDSGAGSLRAAITAATSGDTVQFLAGLGCPSVSPILLTGGTLTLNKNLTIDGTGATIAVDGNSAVTVFRVNSEVSVSINALTIQNGNAGLNGVGGGIFNNIGTLTVANSALVGNSAPGGDGGGIYNNGALTVTNSTLSGNSAGNGGGGIVNFGALTVTNSTFSGNAADVASGGGIFNGGLATLTNMLVAASPTGSDLVGTFSGSNNNLIDDSSGTLTGTGNLTTTPALLGSLGDYGGPTQTIPLLPGSLAIDAGAAVGSGSPGNLVPASDQRGKTRVGVPDIGAFESRGFTLTPMAGSTPQSTLINTAFANPLALTVIANNSVEPVQSGVVFFSSPATGPSATVTGSTVTIMAGGQVSLTATANATVGGPYIVGAGTSGATAVPFMLTNIAPTITLSPATLPGGVKGIGYSQTLTATGSAAPYIFTVTTGALPTGLALSTGGVLSGTPTAVNTFSFIVQARDKNGFTSTQVYTLAIAPATLVSIALTGPNTTPPPATFRVGQKVQITATGTYSDGTTADLTNQVQWSASNASVTKVDATGSVTGESPGGPVTITATLNGITRSFAVMVGAPTPIGITVSAPQGRSGGATGGPPVAPVPAGR